MMELYHDCHFTGNSRFTGDIQATKLRIADKQFVCPSFQLEKRPKLND